MSNFVGQKPKGFAEREEFISLSISAHKLNIQQKLVPVHYLQQQAVTKGPVVFESGHR